jgi:hypothetical protein
MKWLSRWGFLNSAALQVEEKIPAFGEKGPHKEAFYSLLFPWRESEMEVQGFNKVVSPEGGRGEGSLLGSHEAFEDASYFTHIPK